MGNPCHGDSGGPLFDRVAGVAHGVVSSGPPGCGNGALYASVVHQAAFVGRTMQAIAKFRRPEERKKLCANMALLHRRVYVDENANVKSIRHCVSMVPQPTKYRHLVYLRGMWVGCSCRRLIPATASFSYRFPWAKYNTTVLRTSESVVNATCPSCIPFNIEIMAS
jgi:hypothetical protein